MIIIRVCATAAPNHNYSLAFEVSLDLSVRNRVSSLSLRFAGLIVSSSRCATALVESFKLMDDCTTLDRWKCLKCYVVGDTTGRVMRENLSFECEGNTAGNMSNLLEIIAKGL